MSYLILKKKVFPSWKVVCPFVGQCTRYSVGLSFRLFHQYVFSIQMSNVKNKTRLTAISHVHKTLLVTWPVIPSVFSTFKTLKNAKKSEMWLTDQQTDGRTNQLTRWLVESRARVLTHNWSIPLKNTDRGGLLFWGIFTVSFEHLPSFFTVLGCHFSIVLNFLS